MATTLELLPPLKPRARLTVNQRVSLREGLQVGCALAAGHPPYVRAFRPLSVMRALRADLLLSLLLPSHVTNVSLAFSSGCLGFYRLRVGAPFTAP